MRFPYASESAVVSVFADVEQPYAGLRIFAERALHDLREWLGAAHSTSLQPPHYAIYLCRDLETIRQLEEQHGLPRSDPDPLRTFEFRGGFYANVSMIALRCSPREDARWNIAHELSHAAFNEVVGKDCDPINEGLADYNAAKILGWPQAQYLFDAATVAYKNNLIPSLRDLFGLDYWEFRDDRVNWRHMALSWALVRVLLEDESAGIEGRFLKFLATMRSTDPFGALRLTYDLQTLEQAWRAKIESLTRWTQAAGEWSQDGDALEVTTRGGSAIRLHRDRPAASTPYEIRIRLKDMNERTDFGFVIGHVDADNFIVFCIRWAESRVAVCTREGNRWKSTEYVPLKDPPAEWTSDGIQLHCNAEGELLLSYGSRDLARHDLGTNAFKGAVGLFAEPRSHSAEEEFRLSCSYADVRFSPK